MQHDNHNGEHPCPCISKWQLLKEEKIQMPNGEGLDEEIMQIDEVT